LCWLLPGPPVERSLLMLLRVSPVLLVARVLRVLRDVGLAVLMVVRRVALRLHRFACLPGNFLIGADLLAIRRRNGRWMSCHGNLSLVVEETTADALGSFSQA